MPKFKQRLLGQQLRDFFQPGSFITLNLGDGEKEYKIYDAYSKGLTVITSSGLVEITNNDTRLVMEK